MIVSCEAVLNTGSSSLATLYECMETEITKRQGVQNYESSISTSFRVIVMDTLQAITGSVSYSPISITIRTCIDISPKWKDRTVATQTAKYSIILDLPSGLVFSTSSEEISGTPTAIKDSTLYAVTAAGTSPYTGSINATSFSIAVSEIKKSLL